MVGDYFNNKKMFQSMNRSNMKIAGENSELDFTTKRIENTLTMI